MKAERWEMLRRWVRETIKDYENYKNGDLPEAVHWWAEGKINGLELVLQYMDAIEEVDD